MRPDGSGRDVHQHRECAFIDHDRREGNWGRILKYFGGDVDERPKSGVGILQRRHSYADGFGHSPGIYEICAWVDA